MPSIGILTQTAIPDDPRVRRQVEAFRAHGWTVIGVGAEGGSSAPPDCLIETAPIQPHNRSFGSRARRLKVLLRQVLPGSAERVFWKLPENYGGLHALAAKHRPNLWMANDWTMLPIALRLKFEQCVPFVYDTHEFAIEEFAENWKWRTFVRPLVTSIEARGIAEASAVTCVSQGISRALNDLYNLSERPAVIRNLPRYFKAPFRPTREDIDVLYHGLVTPERCLEATIHSVAMWRQEFRLTIRGSGRDDYIQYLRSLAKQIGVADRVVFAQPVPFTSLVEAATVSDVGLFALPGHSVQNKYVLPNKLFEYAMAGLAVCVSDLPEMAHVVNRYALGFLIEEMMPEAIAVAINKLDRNIIDGFKRNSLKAARELSWEVEEKSLIAICERVIARSHSVIEPFRHLAAQS